jgi:hypothetical protein
MSEHAGPKTARAWVLDGWKQLDRQLPLAAWACWQQALRAEAGFPPAREAMDRLLQAAELPLVARTEYRFLPPRGADRRERWNRCLSGRDVQHLAAAQEAFRGLVLADANDVEARMNLALCHAWLGSNAEAIEELLEVARRALPVQPSGGLDVQACMLAELLRQGAGAETLADDLTCTLVVAWTRPTDHLLARLERLGPVLTLPTERPDGDGDGEPAWFTGEWLDRPMPQASPLLGLESVPRVRASLLVGRGTARFSLPTSDPAEMARLERVVEITLGPEFAPIDRQTRTLPIALIDAAVWRIRLPGDMDAETRGRLLREWVELYYEHAWIAQSRRSLAIRAIDAQTPAAAARHSAQTDTTLRARLEGLVAFREQLAQRPSMQHLYQGYPFDRLRRRLGLDTRDPALTEADDVSCMSPEEIEALDVSRLDRQTLLEAYRHAQSCESRPRLALHIVREDPHLFLSLDFPRLGLLALQATDDRASLIAEARRRTTGADDARARLELLEALDRFLRDDSGATEPPVPDDRFFDDYALIQRVCAVLEEARAGDSARALDERGLLRALECSRSWPLPEPQFVWPAHE